MQAKTRFLSTALAAGATVALIAATSGLNNAAPIEPRTAQDGDAIDAPRLGRQAASFDPRDVVLPAGTKIIARTTNTLSTKSHRAGDEFVAHLEEDVTINGRTVASRGSRVIGRVAIADTGGRVKGRAHLAIRLAELRTDYATYDLVTDTRSVTARTTKNKDLKRVGIASGIGAAIGAIGGGGKGAAVGAGVGGGAATGAVLATKGNPAVIPSESVLRFSLTHDAAP